MSRARTYFVILGGILALAGSVSAQEAGVDRTAAARELFEQGVEHMDRQEWADAAALFQRALQLRPSPQITYNLALTLSRDGRVVRAAELMRQLSRDPTADADARARAEALLAQVTPRIAHLTVRIQGELGAGSVLVDERPIDLVMLDVSIPVDPGPHSVTVRRGTVETLARDVSLDDGESGELVLDLSTEVASPAEAARTVDSSPPLAAPTDAGTARDTGGGFGEWWIWAGIGGLVAGGVVLVLVLTLGGGSPEPVSGNGEPGVIRVGGGT